MNSPFLRESDFNTFGRFFLFASIYVFLFMLGTIAQYWNDPDNKFLQYGSWLLLIIWTISWIYLIYFIEQMKKGPREPITIEELDEANQGFVEYLTSYLIPLVAITYDNPIYLFISFIVFIVVFLYIINSNLLFFNPIMLLFGYNFYKIKTKEYKNEIILISDNKDIYTLTKMSRYEVTHLDRGVFLGWRKI